MSVTQASLQGTKPPRGASPTLSPLLRPCPSGWAWLSPPQKPPQPQQGGCQHAVELGRAAACRTSPLGGPPARPCPPQGLFPAPSPWVSVLQPPGTLAGRHESSPILGLWFPREGSIFYSVSHRVRLRVENPWGREGGRQGGTPPATLPPSPRVVPPSPGGHSPPGVSLGTHEPTGMGSTASWLPCAPAEGRLAPREQNQGSLPLAPLTSPGSPAPMARGSPPIPRSPPETRHRR